MSYSICLMDDQIPLEHFGPEFDDTAVVPKSILELLLAEDVEWEGKELKELTEEVLIDGSFSHITAFTNPNFYFNHYRETAYVPEVIVFDWNYPGIDNSEEILKQLLEQTFTIIFIFTRVDESHEIEERISSDEFEEYKNRLFLIHKEDENSVANLVSKLKQKTETNFSFKFGKILRSSSQQVMDSILVELGKASINQIGHYLNLDVENGDKRDFVEFIGERFKNHLISSEDLEEIEFDSELSDELEKELGPKIWSQRLYNYQTDSTRVRKGDIVRNDGDYFLVITADCDLYRHWHKNFGYVSLIPLHKISKENDYLKRQLLLSRTANQITRDFRVTSISNLIKPLPESPRLLPFLKMEGEYDDFMMFPKELFGFEVKEPTLPEHVSLKKRHLSYEDFDYGKIASISEPFLSALIENIKSSISGFGTPDYPQSINELISQKFESMLS